MDIRSRSHTLSRLIGTNKRHNSNIDLDLREKIGRKRKFRVKWTRSCQWKLCGHNPSLVSKPICSETRSRSMCMDSLRQRPIVKLSKSNSMWRYKSQRAPTNQDKQQCKRTTHFRSSHPKAHRIPPQSSCNNLRDHHKLTLLVKRQL